MILRDFKKISRAVQSGPIVHIKAIPTNIIVNAYSFSWRLRNKKRKLLEIGKLLLDSGCWAGWLDWGGCLAGLAGRRTSTGGNLESHTVGPIVIFAHFWLASWLAGLLEWGDIVGYEDWKPNLQHARSIHKS